MFKSYGKFWKNYVNFSGRTTRKDYWLTYLMNMIIGFILGLLILIPIFEIGLANMNNQDVDLASTTFTLLMIVILCLYAYGIAILIPTITITVRRLHDAGFHWAWIFIQLVPFVGVIALIVLMCMPTSDKNIDIFNTHNNDPESLEKWHKLYKDDAISKEEYEAKKKEFLK